MLRGPSRSCVGKVQETSKKTVNRTLSTWETCRYPSYRRIYLCYFVQGSGVGRLCEFRKGPAWLADKGTEIWRREAGNDSGCKEGTGKSSGYSPVRFEDRKYLLTFQREHILETLQEAAQLRRGGRQPQTARGERLAHAFLGLTAVRAAIRMNELTNL